MVHDTSMLLLIHAVILLSSWFIAFRDVALHCHNPVTLFSFYLQIYELCKRIYLFFSIFTWIHFIFQMWILFACLFFMMIFFVCLFVRCDSCTEARLHIRLASDWKKAVYMIINRFKSAAVPAFLYQICVLSFIFHYFFIFSFTFLLERQLNNSVVELRS